MLGAPPQRRLPAGATLDEISGVLVSRIDEQLRSRRDGSTRLSVLYGRRSRSDLLERGAFTGVREA
jgi:hypothetical protein